MAIFTFLPKSEPYLAYFAPVPSVPGWGRDPKIFFQRWLYTTGSYAENFFGIFSAHLRYLPILPFLSTTQLVIFRIEYNAFSKAKFGNFQKLLKLNIYLQTIIIGEKTQFELNLKSFKRASARLGTISFGRQLCWDLVLICYGDMLIANYSIIKFQAKLFNNIRRRDIISFHLL